MSGGWVARRFWTAVVAEPCEGGFTVRLDGRGVKTPAKTPLVVPTMALAQAIAVEWEAQTGQVDPAGMPLTRMANSALDKVRPQFAEVAALIAAYGGSDLLCYRATGPGTLIARQAVAWDPLIAWAAQALDAPLRVTQGVMPVAQDEDSLARLAARVSALSPFELAALHDLVAISGSLILGLAVAEGHLTPDQAWQTSRIDEIWQAELWGSDEDATRTGALRRAALLDAGRFLALCRSQSA